MKKEKITTDEILKYILGFKENFTSEKLELLDKYYEKNISLINDETFMLEVENLGGYEFVLKYLKLQKTLACIFKTTLFIVFLKIIDVYKDDYIFKYMTKDNQNKKEKKLVEKNKL